MSDSACRSQALLEQAPGCHWIVDSNGVFLDVYGECVPLFGKPATELAGRAPADSLPADDALQWRERFSRALSGETFRLRVIHGETAWLVTVFPIRENGAVRYAGGMGREITSYATAERELRYTVLGALKAQEYERSTAARFLHDTVGQNLTALGLQLDLVRMDLESAPDVSARVAEIQKVLETIMEQVREFSYALNPSAVERAGLRSALDRLTTRMRERFTGAVRVNVDPSLKIDPKLATALYGIAQEAIENAVQHASCSAIEIAVKSSRTGPFLEIRDNGKGFDPAELMRGGRGLGLLSMEHYAAQAGLDLSVTSNRENGTTVRAAVPATT